MDPKIADRRSKYLRLATGELVAVAVFLGIGILQVRPALGPGEHLGLWGALGPLAIILLQASAYWFIARSRLGRGGLPTRVANFFKVCRVANVLLLAIGLALLVIHWPSNIGIGLLLAATWVFGVIEYINYFVVRLSYPFTTWFSEIGRRRTPRLVIDVRESSTHNHGPTSMR